MLHKISNLSLIACSILFLVISACNSKEGHKLETNMDRVKILDLTQYSSSSPEKPINLLFIHHSTGGQLLADTVPDINVKCIYKSNPNGGGLRRLLEDANYIVHEASYGSLIGENTDICHWNQKFRDQMEKVLSCKNQDEFFDDSTRNNIIIFKSCFPNSWIESEGTHPGDPDSCVHTTENYKASYNFLLEYFSNQPETLFVAFTAPPLAEPNKLKEFVKRLLGKSKGDSIDSAGRRIRAFNNWLKDTEKGWLKDYKLDNVVVFDYYDVLTDYGKSNWSMYPSSGGKDSHPSSEGNTKAAQAFIPFINKAVNRIGLI